MRRIEECEVERMSEKELLEKILAEMKKQTELLGEIKEGLKHSGL
jgi:hypothetical protein